MRMGILSSLSLSLSLSLPAYRCGDFVDLCRGPHVPHTGVLGALKLTHASAAGGVELEEGASEVQVCVCVCVCVSAWGGHMVIYNACARVCFQVQRVRGIGFPNAKLLKKHVRSLEELAAKGHRAIGTRQKLFFFDGQYSPGAYLLHSTLSLYVHV
jgi:threonyl-tRNA synthetase